MNNRSSNKHSSQVWTIPSRKDRGLHPRTGISATHGERLDLALGELKIGDVLNHRFTIRKRIGVGGMSMVYEAFDRFRNENVALKCISPALLQDPKAVKNFIQEVRVASRLAHPGIVKVFDVHHHQGIYFLEMELLGGMTLREWMKENRDREETRSMGSVHSLIQAICKPLIYAHASTIHRDLKPENIALLPSGEIKIMDFGLAQGVTPQHTSLFRESVSQLSAGTPYYIAPEVLNPEGTVDARADQYSVAVMAFELLTGSFPLGVSSMLSEKRPDLPLKFTEVLDRALNFQPEKRFESIQDFAQALEKSIEPESWIATTQRRWKSIPKLLKAALITLFCASVTLMATSLVKRRLLEKNERVQTWQEKVSQVQSTLNQLQEDIRSLDLEKEILFRRMEVEGALSLESAEPSTAWMQTSNHWSSVDAAYRWMRPKLNIHGQWNSTAALLEATQSAISSESIHEAQPLFLQLEKETGKAIHLVSKVKGAFQIRDSILRLQESALDLHDNQQSKPSLAFLTSDNWEAGLRSLKDQEQLLRNTVEETYQNRWDELERSEEQWRDLFSAALGPPDLKFLVDVDQLKKRSQELFQIEKYDQSLDLMNQVTQTYRQWTREVEDQRNQAQESWSNAEDRIEALDMRLIKLNGVYWSLWETRILDFARWLSDNREIESLILSQLDFSSPGLGPTHPITGLDRRTASGIALWFGYQLNELGRPLGYLPTETDWKKLWGSEGLEGNYQFGITPVEDPARLLVYQDYYLDPQIDPADFLNPTGSGVPSLNGLFDLEGNAWEWSSSDLILDREESNNQEPLKWKLHGGSWFGQHRFNEFEPPRDNSVFITRPQAIGFRIVIRPNKTILEQGRD